MSDGAKNKTRFKTVTPVMIYLSHDDKERLTKYATKNRIPASQVAREGIRMRMDGGDNPYNKGFNDGLNEAMQITRANKGAEMKFPSGKSFADVFKDDIEQLLIKEGHERKATAEELVARVHEGNTGDEDQSDKSLGL